MTSHRDVHPMSRRLRRLLAALDDEERAFVVRNLEVAAQHAAGRGSRPVAAVWRELAALAGSVPDGDR